MPLRSDSKTRVGLREIAAAAELSIMAVSLALRDSPKISASTRDRVRRLAQQLGYQPDPELSRLMRHLRSSRTQSGATGLAIIDLYPNATFEEQGYNSSIRENALRRAHQLGLGVTMIHGADYKLNIRSMLNVIRNRGLEGAILLPSVVPMTLDPAVSWEGISVVVTSNSILSPLFHSVVPHQFSNTMRLIEAVQEQGYRRICGIFDEHFDERTAHNFTAALTWHHHGSRILVLPKSLSTPARRELVESWVAKHHPDLVFAQSADAVGWAESHSKNIPEAFDPEIVALGAPTCGKFSYIDESPDLVGAGAVDLLAGMMYYHEAGIPAHPRTTMIKGNLCFSTGFHAKRSERH